MTLWPRTWWRRTAAVLIYALLATLVALVLTTWLHFHGQTDVQAFGLGLLLLAGAEFFATLLWGLFACPLLDAANPEPRGLAHPRRYLRILCGAPWFVALLCGTSILTLLFSGLEHRASDNAWHWNPPWIPLAWAAGFTLAFSFVAHLFSRAIRRRFHQALLARHLCFNCGYDLRGNPEAPCPECGWQGAAGPVPIRGVRGTRRD